MYTASGLRIEDATPVLPKKTFLICLDQPELDRMMKPNDLKGAEKRITDLPKP
jgi:hypothetical protein